MAHPRYSGEEIQRRAEEIYEQKLRQQLETDENVGKVLVIDIETGDYEMGTDEIAVTHRALEKHPGGTLWGLRIGYNAMHALGGGLKRTQP